MGYANMADPLSEIATQLIWKVTFQSCYQHIVV
jgi:hypothetical protein